MKKLKKRFEKVENSVFSFGVCPCFPDVCHGCVINNSQDTTQSKINQLQQQTSAILQVTGGR
jgi:hypothetical protein